MLRCIIIDDEEILIDEIKYQLEGIEGVEVVGIYTDGLEALNDIDNIVVDIVFVDIEMPEITGIELAKRMNDKREDLSIVFITAYMQYAVDAFNLGAMHYILKPIKKEKLVETIDRVKKLKQKEDLLEIIKGENNVLEKISIKERDSITFIKIKDILYIEAMGSKVEIVTKKEHLNINSNMQFWDEMLNVDNFVRCHRSYIVNMDYIYKLIRKFGNDYQIVLDFKDIKIPVSRQKLADVKEYLGIE